MNIRDQLKSEIIRLLSKTGKIPAEEAEELLEKPKEDIGADFALPCFSPAKKADKHPAQFSKELEKKIGSSKLVKKVKSAGPYLNFYGNWDQLGQILLERILRQKEKFGRSKNNKSILIEHTSANPDGPLHIGHFRNSVIGDSLARIHRFGGWNVKTDFLVNDSGRQIAIAVMEKRKQKAQPKGKKDWWVSDLYIQGNKRLEKNEEKEEELNEMMRKYEKGNQKIRKDYDFIVDNCVQGQKQTLDRLNIKIDNFTKDSRFFFGNQVQQILDEIQKRVDVGRKDGDRIWVDLKQFGIKREFTLTRSDGTAIYPAKDLAYHLYKFDQADHNLNILGTDHKFYAKQLVSTLKLLHPKKVQNYDIVFYEHLILEEGQMSTRRGKFIAVDDLIDRALKEAEKTVEEKMPEYSKKQKEKIAQQVGIGALKYAMLKVSPEKTYSFSIKDTLSFEGNNCPYLQYTHARASSILRKAEKDKKEKPEPKKFKAGYLDQGMELVKLLSEFPRVVRDAEEDYRPHYICNYIYQLATQFNKFYQKVPVLKSKKEERKARLALVQSVKTVLKTGLNLLGIEAPEKM